MNYYDIIVWILNWLRVYEPVNSFLEKYGIAIILKLFIIFVVAVIVLAFVALTVMLLTWLERKVFAHVQARFGPMVTGWHGLLQPIADGVKLFFKEDIVPAKADKWLFTIAPLIVFVPAFLVFVPIPFGKSLIVQDLRVGIIYIIAVSAISPIGVLVAGWASNNKYSLLGALRAAAQDISYEVPLALTALAVVLLAGSLSTQDIVAKQQNIWFIFLMPLGFIIFLIASIAEMGRIPFDLQESEQELVAGFFTEYSGAKFVFFFLAEYAHLFAIAGIITTLFLGGWIGPLIPFLHPEISYFIWFIIKCYAVIFFAMWLRGTVPRVRIDQLLGIGWKVMTPLALINLLLYGFLMVLGVI